MGSNPILSTIFNIESASGNNRFLSCSSSFLYADVRKLRTLPCRWLESYIVTVDSRNQFPHRTSITL